MKQFNELLQIIRKLRGPDGCPWDRAQTIDSFKKHFLEETYELLEAIENRNIDNVREELGDMYLLLSVLVLLYQEKKQITYEEVFDTINAKLVSRHPHVFSDKKLATKEEVLKHWVSSKAKKKRRKTMKDRLPSVAPALVLMDMFLKEYTNHHKPIESKEAEIARCIKELQQSVNAVAQAEDVTTCLVNIVALSASIAHQYHIELEAALRSYVLTRAEQTKY